MIEDGAQCILTIQNTIAGPGGKLSVLEKYLSYTSIIQFFHREKTSIQENTIIIASGEIRAQGNINFTTKMLP